MADEGGPVMDPQQLEALIPSGEQALPASMPAPPSKLKLFLMIPKVKLGLIIAGSVVAVLLLITALAFGVCYRGPVKMDFDPESDVAVTDVSTSGGSEEGFAKAHVVFNLRVKAFIFNPNNMVAAQITRIQAKVSYLNDTEGLQFLGMGVNTEGTRIPGGMSGERTSAFVYINIRINVTAIEGGKPSAAQRVTNGIAKKIGNLCQNSSPKEPRKFKIKIEMTGEAKLLSSRAPLNRVVDSMDIDCPQSVEKPAGLFLETGERAAWERAADDDRDFAARSLNGDTALRGRV